MSLYKLIYSTLSIETQNKIFNNYILKKNKKIIRDQKQNSIIYKRPYIYLSIKTIMIFIQFSIQKYETKTHHVFAHSPTHPKP